MVYRLNGCHEKSHIQGGYWSGRYRDSHKGVSYSRHRGILNAGEEKPLSAKRRQIKSLGKVGAHMLNERTTPEAAFAMRKVQNALLCRLAMQGLDVISCLHEVSAEDLL